MFSGLLGMMSADMAIDLGTGIDDAAEGDHRHLGVWATAWGASGCAG